MNQARRGYDHLLRRPGNMKIVANATKEHQRHIVHTQQNYRRLSFTSQSYFRSRAGVVNAARDNDVGSQYNNIISGFAGISYYGDIYRVRNCCFSVR